jgi:hypothetical protein
LGGSLDGVTIQLLADMLVGTAPPNIFPCRIEIRKRGRGRPAAQKKENVEFNQKTKTFLKAIASRDMQAAADILGHTSSLDAADLEILADLLGENPKSDIALRYRLKLVRHRKGNPVVPLESKARAFVLNLLVEETGVSKTEAAIQDVKQKPA